MKQVWNPSGKLFYFECTKDPKHGILTGSLEPRTCHKCGSPMIRRSPDTCR